MRSRRKKHIFYFKGKISILLLLVMGLICVRLFTPHLTFAEGVPLLNVFVSDGKL